MSYFSQLSRRLFLLRRSVAPRPRSAALLRVVVRSEVYTVHILDRRVSAGDVVNLQGLFLFVIEPVRNSFGYGDTFAGPKLGDQDIVHTVKSRSSLQYNPDRLYIRMRVEIVLAAVLVDSH